MRADLTDVTIILDRSGSMGSIKNDVIGGLNQFFDDQRKVPGDLLVTLVQFDDGNPFEVIHSGKSVKDVPNLTADVYQPRGSTPLLDAIGRGINATGKRLGAMPENDRPSKVVFVIQTDGYENASKEFTAAQISEMITLQRDTYKWEFVFLGANQDAIATAASIGIGAATAMSYKPSGQNVRAMYGGVSANLCANRIGTSSTMDFSDDDRSEAVK